MQVEAQARGMWFLDITLNIARRTRRSDHRANVDAIAYMPTTYISLLMFELIFQPLAPLPSPLGPADSHDRRSMRLFLYGVELSGYPWARGVQGRLQSVHGRGLPLDDGWMVFAALIGSERGKLLE